MLDSYRKQVAQGLALAHGTDATAHVALGLAGEAGECADLVKKAGYPNGSLNTAKLIEELGDLLWYITAMCNILQVDLGTLIVTNITKLEERHPERGYSVEKLRG